MKKVAREARAIKFSIEKEGKEVARAYLYFIENNLHEAPYVLLEDVFVIEECRGQGLANQVVLEAIETARVSGCYKIIANSRNDGSRIAIHEWYERLGFLNYGSEFRMDYLL